VADSRNRGHSTGGNGARHALVVEAPQVLERAAAARHDQYIAFVTARRGFDGAHDFRYGRGALHGGGIKKYRRHGEACAQHSQYVVYGGARGRGDHADAARHRGQRTFALYGKQSFGRQPGLELLEFAFERAFTSLLEMFHQQLVFAARFIESDPCAYQHRHAVLGAEPQQ
jgi:hypothetical protein